MTPRTCCATRRLPKNAKFGKTCFKSWSGSSDPSASDSEIISSDQAGNGGLQPAVFRIDGLETAAPCKDRSHNHFPYLAAWDFHRLLQRTRSSLIQARECTRAD